MTLSIKTVGILSPGDMGSAVGAVLRQHGIRIVTSLEGRSSRTRELAAKGGFEDLGTLDELVRQSDAVLCILVPSEALNVSHQVAAAVERTGSELLYVDCNAVAPKTVGEISEAIMAVGVRFADAGIIGGPPGRSSGRTHIYSSGPGAREFAELAQNGLDIRVLEGEIGQASGLKMCYGAMTKGLQALGVELMTAAKVMGLDSALRGEQTGGLAGVLSFLERSVPIMPPKAHRWVGEMEEISACFADLGMTPTLLLGAAEMYKFVASTPIGQESPENRDRARDLDGVVSELAKALTAELVTHA